VALLSLACGGGGGGSTPSSGGDLTAHLAGVWSANSVVSGSTAWWSRGRLTVTPAGATTGTLAFYGGDPDEVVTTAMLLSADRVWTLGVNPSAEGAVDCLDRLIAFTASWPGGAAPHPTEMGLLVRMGTSYATGDLAGTWETRSLAAGDGTASWSSALASIAPDGTFVSTTTTNAGGAATVQSGRLYLSPDGVTTLAGSTQFRGAMDAQKTIMVSTDTSKAGAMTELRIAVRMAAAYAQSDLAGTWRSYTLASGPGEPWWERGSGTIDAAGSYSGTATESSGGGGPKSGTFTLAANGHLTLAGVPTYAVLDASKSVIVWANTWSGTWRPGTAELKVFVRIR
jgi:hypothetical protein